MFRQFAKFSFSPKFVVIRYYTGTYLSMANIVLKFLKSFKYPRKNGHSNNEQVISNNNTTIG